MNALSVFVATSLHSSGVVGRPIPLMPSAQKNTPISQRPTLAERETRGEAATRPRARRRGHRVAGLAAPEQHHDHDDDKDENYRADSDVHVILLAPDAGQDDPPTPPDDRRWTNPWRAISVTVTHLVHLPHREAHEASESGRPSATRPSDPSEGSGTPAAWIEDAIAHLTFRRRSA